MGIKKTALLAVSSALLLVSFQNCSQQFKVEEETGTSTANSILSAPVVSFTQEIPSLVNTALVSGQFEVLGTDIMSVMCSLNGASSQDCSTRSINYGNLSDDDYTVEVVATNIFGVTGSARRLFRKDSTAPVIEVTMMPLASSAATSAGFVFSVTDNLSGVANVQCSLDNAVFTNCTSPVNLSGLSVAVHNFRIQARDNAGNMSAVYNFSWTVVPPVNPMANLLSLPPSLTNQTSVSLSFSGAGVVSFECQLDAAAFAACVSPFAANNIPAGAHTFRVRGITNQGLRTAEASATWTVDLTAPTSPNLISSTPTVTNLIAASFNFSSMDASGIASYQCSLDNAAFAVCTSPHTLTNLTNGTHSLRVRASDNAGNASGISLLTWNIDNVAPLLAFTQTPVNSANTTASFVFSSADPGSGLGLVQCSLDNAPFANCTSPVDLTNLSVNSHSFRVQARDLAGNSSLITHNWVVTSNVPPPPATGLAYYFSDCQAGSVAGCVPGNNANAGTSAASPKRDLTGINLNTLPAGTSLLFARGGSFNHRVQIVNPNATAAAPITFADYGTGALPILRTTSGTGTEFGSFSDTTFDGGYTLRNLVLEGAGTGQWAVFARGEVHDITIENVEMRNFLIGVHSAGQGRGVHNLTIRNSYIHNMAEHGILGGSVNLLLDGNRIANNNPSGGGFEHGAYLSSGGSAPVGSGRIINNVFSNNSAPNGVCDGGNLTMHGVWDGVVIEGNRIEQVASTGGCYGISITAAYSTAEAFRNFTVRNNTVLNVGNCAFCLSSAPGVLIENNRAFNTQSTYQVGVLIPAITPGPEDAVDSGAIIRNNVICHTAPVAGSDVVRAPSAATVTGNIYQIGAAASAGACAL